MRISVKMYRSNYTVMLSFVSRVVSDQLLYLRNSADRPQIFVFNLTKFSTHSKQVCAY